MSLSPLFICRHLPVPPLPMEVRNRPERRAALQVGMRACLRQTASQMLSSRCLQLILRHSCREERGFFFCESMQFAMRILGPEASPRVMEVCVNCALEPFLRTIADNAEAERIAELALNDYARETVDPATARPEELLALLERITMNHLASALGASLRRVLDALDE